MIPILMDYVNCFGSEVGLWDCVHFTHSYSGCSHSDDAGVRCQPGIYLCRAILQLVIMKDFVTFVNIYIYNTKRLFNLYLKQCSVMMETYDHQLEI